MSKVLRNIVGTAAVLAASAGLMLLGAWINQLSKVVSAGDYSALGLPVGLLIGAVGLGVVTSLLTRLLKNDIILCRESGEPSHASYAARLTRFFVAPFG